MIWRLVTVLLIAASLVLPRATAALASLSGATHVIVVCTPEGLQTLTIGPDGVPRKHKTSSDHCPLVHVTSTEAALHLPAWSTLRFQAVSAPNAASPVPVRAPGPPFAPRAPPAVV